MSGQFESIFSFAKIDKTVGSTENGWGWAAHKEITVLNYHLCATSLLTNGLMSPQSLKRVIIISRVCE